MWAEQLPNGKYKFCERYTDPVTGQTRRVSVTLDKNTAQSRKMASEILRQKMAVSSPSTLTFGELCALYLDAQSLVVKVSTLDRNRHALNVVKSILGDSVASESMSAGYVRRKLLATGKSATTLNEYITRIKALFRWGYKNDYVSDIRWLDKLDKLPDAPHRQKIEDKFLEASELSALLESMQHTLWHDVTAFLALSGLRFGECAALTRSDIDGRVIHVTKNYDYMHDVTTTPKNYSSVRDVYMQDELYDLCQVILRRDNLVSIGNLLFSARGEHISYFAYNKYLKSRSRQSIGREITPHTLRHTHASLMLEAGMDVDSIAARLGHSTSKVTREIYLHVTEKLQEKRNAEIKNIRLII